MLPLTFPGFGVSFGVRDPLEALCDGLPRMERDSEGVFMVVFNFLVLCVMIMQFVRQLCSRSVLVD